MQRGSTIVRTLAVQTAFGSAVVHVCVDPGRGYQLPRLASSLGDIISKIGSHYRQRKDRLFTKKPPAASHPVQRDGERKHATAAAATTRTATAFAHGRNLNLGTDAVHRPRQTRPSFAARQLQLLRTEPTIHASVVGSSTPPTSPKTRAMRRTLRTANRTAPFPYKENAPQPHLRIILPGLPIYFRAFLYTMHSQPRRGTTSIHPHHPN